MMLVGQVMMSAASFAFAEVEPLVLLDAEALKRGLDHLLVEVTSLPSDQERPKAESVVVAEVARKALGRES